MTNRTSNLNLYKWDKTDSKQTTITEMATNMDVIDSSLAEIMPQNTPKMKGASFYFKTDTDINNVSDSILDQVKNDGVTHIALCPILVNDDTINNSNLAMSYTTSALTNLVSKVSSKGFQFIFKFHLGKKSNGQNAYSDVPPTDPTTLFNQLQTCILTTLSVSQNVALVCMANESPMLTHNYRSNWQTLINAIRSQNPTIKITNSPTFADMQNDSCVFWDLCDYIGTNIYPMVTKNAVPSVQEVRKAMSGELSSNSYTYVQKLYYLTQKYNKDFIITEFAILPYEYQASATGSWQAQGAYNEQVQANYYQGVFDVFLNMEHCAGIFIWSLTDNYTFINRQAESVVSSSFKGVV